MLNSFHKVLHPLTPTSQVFNYGYKAAKEIFLLVSLCFLSFSTVEAQEEVEIEVTEFRIEDDIVYLDIGPTDSNVTNLQVQYSVTLQNWFKDLEATLTDLGDNRFRATIPLSYVDAKFFRVFGQKLSEGVDPDDDGLPTEYENDPETPATDPELFDTDSDSFDDGEEIALGTDPTDPNSFPELAHLPAVEFMESNSIFTEGEEIVYKVPLSIDQPYSGTLYYTINERSSAVVNEDYTPLSGSILVDGTSAAIDISFIDDFTISEQRLLMIDIQVDPDVDPTYRRGGRSTHVVILNDNDSYWHGVIKDELTERNFRLRMLRKTGQATEIAFVAGTADGLIDFDGGASSQSTGLVPETPQNVWEAIEAIDTTEQFKSTSPPLPIVASTFPGFGGNGFNFSSEPLYRVLTLEATQSIEGHEIRRDLRIIGEYTEKIALEDPSKNYLNSTRRGSFVLIKDIPVSPPSNSLFSPDS